jgi:hypothetical protein
MTQHTPLADGALPVNTGCIQLNTGVRSQSIASGAGTVPIPSLSARPPAPAPAPLYPALTASFESSVFPPDATAVVLPA